MTGTIDFQEAITLLVSYAFIWFEVSKVPVKEFREYYEKSLPNLDVKFPSWIFSVMWFAIKNCIALSLFYFLRKNTTVQLSILILWIVNEALRKYWTFFFIDLKMSVAALVVCLGILGTGAAVLILLIVHDHYTSVYLLIPYVAWVVVALFLNSLWVSAEQGANCCQGRKIKWKATARTTDYYDNKRYLPDDYAWDDAARKI